MDLFRQLGTNTPSGLGLLGLTVDEAYGGVGLDATSVCLVHEELSYADPAFCLAYLAHSLLLVNNLSVNATHEQKQRFLPDACAGTLIGGMGMSEPAVSSGCLFLSSFLPLCTKLDDFGLIFVYILFCCLISFGIEGTPFERSKLIPQSISN